MVTIFSLIDESRLTARATARLVLNYKDIPYRTEWLKHQEIAPKLKEL